MPKIAIIGGGPSAISLCKQLCDNYDFRGLSDELEITVFEKSDKIGGGLPYSFEDSTFILNLPASVMEPVYRDSGHFSKWLECQADCPADTNFPPRYFFGRYLEHVSQVIQEEVAVKGIKIIYKTNNEVNDISECELPDLYKISCTTGTYYANYVVLATGHMASANFKKLEGAWNRYEHNPWDRSLYSRLDLSADTAIIGTRLTAIDTALKLEQMNFKGKIHLASRMGLLPAVLPDKIITRPLLYLTLQNFTDLTNYSLRQLKLDDLLDLFWREIAEAEGPGFDKSQIITSSKNITALDWITNEITRAQKGDSKWQQVLFSFYSVIPNIWSLLSFADQKRFLNEHYGLFMTYLAAFPIKNALKIKDMLVTGKLEVSGGLEDIVPAKAGFLLQFDTKKINVGQVINATGSGYQLSTVKLYKKMLKKHLITEHSLGGIRVDAQTLQVLDKTEQPRHSIFALGELTRGTCLMTADMSRVSGQANRVSDSLGNSLLKTPAHRQSPIINVVRPAPANLPALPNGKKMIYNGFFTSPNRTIKTLANMAVSVATKRFGSR